MKYFYQMEILKNKWNADISVVIALTILVSQCAGILRWLIFKRLGFVKKKINTESPSSSCSYVKQGVPRWVPIALYSFALVKLILRKNKLRPVFWHQWKRIGNMRLEQLKSKN